MAYGNADAYVARQPDRLLRGHVYAPAVHAYAHVRVGSAVRTSGGVGAIYSHRTLPTDPRSKRGTPVVLSARAL
jgi:hypothetical protein